MTIPSLPFFSLPDNSFYNSHYNIFVAPKLSGLSVYWYVYLFLALLVVAIFILKTIHKKPMLLARKVLLCCWLLWVGILLLQTFHQGEYVSRVHKNIGHLSDEKRYAILFEYAYEIARSVALRVEPGSAGMIVAGEVKHSIDVVSLPYFLYPKLDVVRVDRPPKYILVFLRSDYRLPVKGKFKPVIIDRNNPTVLLERVDDGR